MNGAFEHLIAPIYRYEGTLARLMGDAIFAFFGAPIAHEDDPQRAVSAGLDIIDGIQAYRERQRADRGLDLNVRVGINTGPGGGRRGRVGPPPGVHGDGRRGERRGAHGADRRAGDGPDHGRDLSTDRLVLRRRVPRRGRGEGEDGAGVRVPGRRPEAAAGDAAHERAATPLVGREREMEILTRAIADVHEGRGRIVSLIAEAGLGKSRLIEETQREWARRRPDEDPRSIWDVRRIWEVWQCVSYDTTRPYAQYRRMLARIAGIGDTDPPDVVREKLVRTIDFSAEWVNLTCASGAHSSVCRNLTKSRSRGRRSRTRSCNWFRHRLVMRAPHLGCWCSRTSTGATRRRWTC